MRCQFLAFGLAFVLLVVLTSMSWKAGKAPIEEPAAVVAQKGSSENRIMPDSGPTPVSLGEAVGVPYYHCSGGGGGNNDGAVSLVLLHGARFTKEDWKNPPGILADFCSRKTERKVNVFAVDLPTKTDYEGLSDFLDAMVKEGKLSKPVSLVTPSTSGKTMVSWAGSTETSLQKLPEYINKWIPVAAISVNQAPQKDITRIGKDLPILAIHGDQDHRGRDSSKRLETLLDAQVLELSGRHPCYLDSPKEFVDAVVKFIDN